jgi:predicted acylesterase/phospholipase RssA
VKAHLDAGLLPNIISGTSGGALVAALACTRTDCELKELLVPELSEKITACHDDVFTWIKRWYRTGARFDSVDWARRCCWFTRGSMTFKEAFNRTGRVLNISCIPSDPHSPSLLLNHLTAPDCCIFSAVLASAAVPGILNPVVLMTRTRNGTIAPYSFGNKWKDGSLRTDIPLRALNLRFNANFSIVSQVNPHVNIFFFASRGAVGRPVTHRRGKGWRGGFLGSALEQYLKLDLAKWLKVTRHLELLPRPLEQDWSGVFLQKFDGTITLWPKTSLIDFWYILSDPSRERLSRMLDRGQAATWPKLKFVANRLRIERAVEQGRQLTRISKSDSGDVSQSQTLDSPPPQNPPHGLSEGLTVARAEENKREFTSWSSWLSSLKLEPQGGIGEGHGNKVYIEDSTTSCSGDEGDGDDEDEGDSDIDARIDNDVGSGGEILFMNGDSQGNDDGKIQKPVEKFEARSETVLGG